MDRTEGIRRVMVQAIDVGKNREQLEVDWDTVYNTEEVSKSFSIQGFMAPFVVAVEKSTGKKCTLMFQHEPRFYWFDSYV